MPTSTPTVVSDTTSARNTAHPMTNQATPVTSGTHHHRAAPSRITLRTGSGGPYTSHNHLVLL